MYIEEHTLKTLFEQLGLGSSDEEIKTFVSQHTLEDKQNIADASFWSDSQAAFIQEALQSDADWAIVVDELDAMLRVNTN